MSSNIICNISVSATSTETRLWGNFLSAPLDHKSYELSVNTTKLQCNAIFKGVKSSCGKPSGYDIKFTAVAIGPKEHSVNEQGKKILFVKKIENVVQNDPFCPKGAFTDAQLYNMMLNQVLKAAN